MNGKTKRWIKETLSNDEASTNQELLEHFIREGKLTPDEASRWIALRGRYLLEIFCDAEPGKEEPEVAHQLPTVEGYTMDKRLQEFRKIKQGKALEFVPFASAKGKYLLNRLKAKRVRP